MVRRATVLIVILLAALALVACGKDSPLDDQAGPVKEPDSTVATNTTTIPPRSAHDGCEAVAAPTPPATPPAATRSRRRLSPKRRHVATLVTNCGTIRILLDVKRAPKTTASFAGLARSGFYDGLTFHRIAKPGGNDYVIQGGDPLGTGNGGPGFSVVEAPAKNTRYRRYVVAMAKTQAQAPGTSGSQFFVVTAPDAALPPDYAILGRVVGDKTAVKRIAAVPTDPTSEAPLDPVVMSSVRISATG